MHCTSKNVCKPSFSSVSIVNLTDKGSHSHAKLARLTMERDLSRNSCINTGEPTKEDRLYAARRNAEQILSLENWLGDRLDTKMLAR